MKCFDLFLNDHLLEVATANCITTVPADSVEGFLSLKIPPPKDPYFATRFGDRPDRSHVAWKLFHRLVDEQARCPEGSQDGGRQRKQFLTSKQNAKSEAL